MIDYIQRTSTIHTYTGGSDGPASIDGDWATSMYDIVPSHQGPSNASVQSEHTFSGKRIIKQIDFKITSYARNADCCVFGYGKSNSWSYEYYNYDTLTWTTFPGASGSGEAGAHITLTVDDFGKIRTDKVRATASGSSWTNCSGGDSCQETEAGGRIYEMQCWVKPKAYARIM